MRSSLAKHQTQSPLTDKELYERKRKGWIEEETLVVTKRQREGLSMKEHEAVIAIGTKLYGKGSK